MYEGEICFFTTFRFVQLTCSRLRRQSRLSNLGEYVSEATTLE